MQNIANKVVIITGASSGIGEATALKLAAEGAKLVLGARREDKLKAIMEALRMESAQAGSNIRTATIYPAAVQSELVNHITDENASAGYRQLYDTYEIPAARVAEVVAFALAQPDDTNISEFTIGPTTQPW